MNGEYHIQAVVDALELAQKRAAASREDMLKYLIGLALDEARTVSQQSVAKVGFDARSQIIALPVA